MKEAVEAKCITAPAYTYHWQSDLFFEVHAAEDGNTKFPKSWGGQEGHTGDCGHIFIYFGWSLFFTLFLFSFFHVTKYLLGA